MKNVLILILLIVYSCKTKEKIQESQADTGKKSVMLYKGACYGTCSSYKFSLKNDCSFIYIGEAYVKKLGKHSGKLTEEETAFIFKKLNKLDWNKYPEEYPIDNYDFPQFTLEYNSDKMSKKIQGNSNAAKEILEFNAFIDSLLNDLKMEKTE